MRTLNQILCLVFATSVITNLLFYVFYEYLFYFTVFCTGVILSVISWNLGCWIFDLMNYRKIDPEYKSVLITGCDTGFGNLLAQRLCDLGFYVYAGVLFPEGNGALELHKKYSKKLKILKLDVCSREDVEGALRVIRSDIKHTLWAVVNNAGIISACPWDWGQDLDLYRKQFEVNIFGAIRVTKNCVPLLRKTGGRIVNMSSASGRITAPLLAPYTMTKHSIRSFSNSLRREIFEHNVQVVTIEPTHFSTSICDHTEYRRMRSRFRTETPPEIASAYGPEYDLFMAKCDQDVVNTINTDVDYVVDTMVKAVMLKCPQVYYRCKGYHLGDYFSFISEFIPEILLDALLLNYYNGVKVKVSKENEDLIKNV